MKSHLRAGLIALASVTIALAANGSAAAVTLPDDPAHTAPAHTLIAHTLIAHTLIAPTPSVSPSPAPSSSASASPGQSTAAPASTSTVSNLDPDPRPLTNLTAVVNPVAVPVHGGFLIRVGARNSGPLSITAPAGQPAVKLSLVIDFCCLMTDRIKSLGGCEVGYYYPPNWPTSPEEPHRYDCSYSKRTLRVGETYWESFVFSDLSLFTLGVSVTVSGYAQDPNDSDNSRKVEVHPAAPGSSLPVTGSKTIGFAGVGLALVVAGTMAIWYGRRRRLIGPTGSAHIVAGEPTP